MPIYEYACRSCSHQFELRVSSMDADVGCPTCGGHEVQRRLSSFSFRGGAPEPSFDGGGCGRCGSDTPGQCNLN